MFCNYCGRELKKNEVCMCREEEKVNLEAVIKEIAENENINFEEIIDKIKKVEQKDHEIRTKKVSGIR